MHLTFSILGGEDYINLTEIVEFPSGETEKNIIIHILDDNKVESNETFELYLTGGARVRLSPLCRAEVTIQENDGNSKP